MTSAVDVYKRQVITFDTHESQGKILLFSYNVGIIKNNGHLQEEEYEK